jgi:GT2 family glycosyltransferase
MNPSERKRLSCAVGIATYKRPDILLECLGCLLQQTRMPDEVVIADASPDADANRARVQQELPRLAAATRFAYLTAAPGLTRQRNLILDSIQSDVILFLDDDTLAGPTYVEKMLAVYEADTAGRVGGVEGAVVEGAALEAADAAAADTPVKRPGLVRRLKGRAMALLEWAQHKYCDQAFPAAVCDVPLHGVPDELKHLRVEAQRVLYGCAMSYRTALARRERANEHLGRYALLEDFDLSFRVGRTHALLRCLDAPCRHLRIQGGRLDPSLVAYLWMVNTAFITRTALPDGPEVRRHLERHLRRTVRFEGLLGGLRKTRFSQYRAARAGREQALAILNAPADQVAAVYEQAAAKGFDKGKF